MMKELLGRAKRLREMQNSKLSGKDWHIEYGANPITNSIRRHKNKAITKALNKHE